MSGSHSLRHFIFFWAKSNFLNCASAFTAAHSPKVGRTITKNLCAAAKNFPKAASDPKRTFGGDPARFIMAQ